MNKMVVYALPGIFAFVLLSNTEQGTNAFTESVANFTVGEKALLMRRVLRRYLGN